MAPHLKKRKRRGPKGGALRFAIWRSRRRIGGREEWPDVAGRLFAGGDVADLGGCGAV